MSHPGRRASWLVRLYPPRWRERYGAEFDALLEESGRGPRTALDVGRGALDARLREAVAGRRLLPWLALLAAAALVGWLDFHAGDGVQPVAGALLVLGFGFGWHRPRRAWLLAAVLFLAVPAAETARDALAYHPGAVKPAPLYESVLALVPALVGAYAGAGLRRLARTARG
jgi:hypothetical protein